MRVFLALLLLAPGVAFANPAASGRLTAEIWGAEPVFDIAPGAVGFHRFSSKRNSGVFTVRRSADVCMNLDAYSGLESNARAQVRRVIASATAEGSVAYGAELDGCRCVTLETGSYYISVTTRPTSAHAVVSVTGR